MNFKTLHFKILSLCLLAMHVFLIQSAARTYYFGILPERKPSVMLSRFIRFEKYLKDYTGLDIKLRIYPSGGVTGGYSAIVEDIASGKIDFAYLAPATCVQARGIGPVTPVVCPVKNGEPLTRGYLAVRSGSAYNSIYDLQGKKICGTSASSTSGNLMPSGWMLENGIDKHKFFSRFEYAGRHDKAAEAVIIGKFDACFINESTFIEYNSQEPLLRAVWEHIPVPEFPVCVNTMKVKDETLAEVIKALIVMHEADPEVIKDINTRYERWIEIKWEEYEAVKRVIDYVYGSRFYDLEYWKQRADIILPED